MVMSVTRIPARAVPRSVQVAGVKVNNSPVPSGYRVAPGRAITLFAQLTGLYGGDTVRFTIRNAGGMVVFGPVQERKNLFSNYVDVLTVAPTAIGLYTMEATEQIPFFPDSTAFFSFEVSLTPDPEPAPTPGGGGIPGFLDEIKNLLIVGAVVAVVVAVAPTINAVGQGASRVGGK